MSKIAPGLTGVDWPDIHLIENRLGGMVRKNIGLPGLSEPEVVRHYTRLSQKNYAIDTGLYPLGSCTMKHNPRVNEKVARFFGDVHPMQPLSSVQGALEIIHQLAHWLTELTGLPRRCNDACCRRSWRTLWNDDYQSSS